ncbi:hypothetical protein [Streptomyces sp. TS71-3]|uniref:hypothetical protein n=1 Tax=Streptomyces sp. TS71-3 TaxID=2733862 RepID=UPI001BB35753|nr:hypothetical protein [Streptomyces sp. TS71-3]
MAVTPLLAGIGVCAVRLLYAWLRARAALRLGKVSESRPDSRVRSLPSGSLLPEQRADRGQVVVQVGGTSATGPGGVDG